MTAEESSKRSIEAANALPATGSHKVGEFCMALLGDQCDAEAALGVCAENRPEGSGQLERSAWFAAARAECARLLERRPDVAAQGERPSASSSVPARGRALLDEAYPTERDALALRLVAELDWAEVALATGTDEASAKRRASCGLSRIAQLGQGESNARPTEECTAARTELLPLLEGVAGESTQLHFAECDVCRDHRHAASRALGVIRQAGSDFKVAAALSRDPAPLPAAAAKRGARVQRGWVVAGAVGIAATFALFQRGRSAEDPTQEVPLAGPRVEVVSSPNGKSGLAACAPSGSPCQMLESGARVPSGSRLRTDFATRATLAFDDGSRLSMERGGELALRSSGPPELLRGSFVVELAGTGARALDLPHGSVSAQRAKFSIRLSPDDASIEVVRGSVQVRDRAGGEVALRAGEQTRLGQGPLVALAVPELGESIAWSEQLRSDRDEQGAPRGLGELAAKRPGAQQELEGSVRMALHRVKTRITGPIARTEIEEVFTNTTDEVLEGIYRFPLPPDAKIERLALEVDGKLMEGAFVERDRAAAIWRGAIVNTAPAAKALMREDIVWVPGPWKDPALLEWQRGGRFELRIFPIPKRGSRRIVLAYTEHLRPAGETRRYTYPLPHDPSGSTRVDRFELDLQVRGHDPRLPVRATGYELSRAKQGDADTLTLESENFGPTGDLGIEYSLPDRDAELSAFSYASAAPSSGSTWNASDGDPYVALAIRPKLPRATESVPRDFAIVVDSSRSMFGESFERAKRVAARLVREIDPEDRVIVLACDSDCRRAPNGLSRPGPEAEREARRFLDELTADGASDLARAQVLAYEALPSNSDREGRIVFIGDGAPTMGPLRADHIEASVARALPLARVRVTTLAVGAESDLESLSAVARGGGGVVLPYVAGQTVSEAALAVLGTAYGRVLRNVRLTLPDGLVGIAPSRLDAVPAGGELLVAARLRGSAVDGTVTLTGEVSGRPFEQRYVLRLSPGGGSGNAFVPRLHASLRIADLERDGSAEARKAALELSSRFNVQSRYTSLLVLESQAMFQAFGLVNQRTAPEWSGEEDLEGTSADGELALDDAAQTADPELGAAMGSGRAGAAPAAAPAAAARNALPSKAAPPTDSRALSSEAEKKSEIAPGWPLAFREEEAQRRRMIPMRRVWERVGEVSTSRFIPKKATADMLAKAEREARSDENRRDLTRKLHGLLAAASELERAEQVLIRWLERDPLDPDALTARADLAARRGSRSEAIRLLGSVVDARPGDVSAQRRLERLHRWAGRPEIGCRHLVAAAELRTTDVSLLADAVRCSLATGEAESANRLLASATPDVRRKADGLLAAAPPDDSELRGDLKLDARWSGDMDLDLSLVDTDGFRVSWLGAPTRSVIMARDAVSSQRESLALRGAKPGEYVIEIVRGDGGGPASGELTVTVAGATRRIPFSLSGTRATLGVAVIRLEPRLVPL